MFNTAVIRQRIHRYFLRGDLVSMATAVAAYHGEPALAHQLELMHARSGLSVTTAATEAR
jgi:hypothetical protein